MIAKASLILALFLIAAGVLAQTTGPITTPQINTTRYVDQVRGFYPTIQAAVTAACGTSGGGRVSIPFGASPSDSPTTVTGCANAPIADERATPTNFYTSTGAGYTLVNFTFTLNPATPTDLGGVYLATGQSSATLAKVATTGAYGDLSGTPTNLVTTDTTQTITAAKTFSATTTLFQAVQASTSVGCVSPGVATGSNNISGCKAGLSTGSLWSGTAGDADTFWWENDISPTGGYAAIPTYTLHHTDAGGGTGAVSMPFNGDLGIGAGTQWNFNYLFGNRVQALQYQSFNTPSSTSYLASAGTVVTPGNANVSSPAITSEAYYYNGTVGVPDDFSWNDIIGTNATTTPTAIYTLTHSGSSGAVSVSIPYATTLASVTLSGLSGSSGDVALIGTGGLMGAGPASANISLLNGAQTFTALKTFSSGLNTSALGVTGTITNSVGLQIATATGCTVTAGAVGNTCTVTMTLPVTEPDANYHVNGCSFLDSGSATGPLYVADYTSPTTTSFVTSLNAGSTTAHNPSGGTVACIVTHN